MKTEVFADIDRSKWKKGPWDNEPDKVVWIDEKTNLDCMMVRNDLGNWCGYVGVPPGHPLHGVGYSQCAKRLNRCKDSYCDHSPESILRVHGGITFSDFCHEGGRICHVPEEGRPDHVYWFGFDCAHYMDHVPGIDRISSLQHGGVYRDMIYVQCVVIKLAQQSGGDQVNERCPCPHDRTWQDDVYNMSTMEARSRHTIFLRMR